MVTNKNITREQFIELSGLLFISQSHNLKTVVFEGKTLDNEFVINILDSYRDSKLPITETGKIPWK